MIKSAVSQDSDGSETVTLRITGLDAQFDLVGATLVSGAAGEDRLWTLTPSQLNDVKIVVPQNYSGTVELNVAVVTTEVRGSSLTAEPVPISFVVTPTPEAIVQDSATLGEDSVSDLNITLIAQNGDTDEQLGDVYIAVADAVSSTFTVYLGDVALASAVGVDIIDGYYVIPASDVGRLAVKAAPDADGNIGSLAFQYDVIDTAADASVTTTDRKSGSIALNVTPQTDAVTASLENGVTELAMASAGVYTVNVAALSADTDGSEMVTRILITGVPEGVTVLNAAQIGTGVTATWVLQGDSLPSVPMGVTGVTIPVQFIVGSSGANGTASVVITVQAQDRGTADVVEDKVNLDLIVNLPGGPGDVPPTIVEWEYNGEPSNEDAPFNLASKVDAVVETANPAASYSYTVTLRDVTVGTQVSGMIATKIDGAIVYTATVQVGPGENSQDKLETLLETIVIRPPADMNSSNGAFHFDAKLSGSVLGGESVERDMALDIPLQPVADPASIAILVSDANEGQTAVRADIRVANGVDGAQGEIADGQILVSVDAPTNGGGYVTDADGTRLVATEYRDVEGIDDGFYYVLQVGPMGGTTSIFYNSDAATGLNSGDVTFTAYVPSKEQGAGNTAIGQGSATAEVLVINNGVTFTVPTNLGGLESDEAIAANAIPLTFGDQNGPSHGMALELIDQDGSERMGIITLSGLPQGFALYVGDTAASATLASQASNAGGTSENNLWVVSTSGGLPPYVAILPPVHWSGTLTDLVLNVSSKEGTLKTSLLESFPLGDFVVEAVANGVGISPTLSFGQEGTVIRMNLNPAMVDQLASQAGLPDQSVEFAALSITGLGPQARFFVGDSVWTDVTYSSDTDSYQLTGLTQSDLFTLGFVQSADGVTDQDLSKAGKQISVEAWTYEVPQDPSATAPTSISDRDAAMVTVDIIRPIASGADDSFVFGGKAINGLGGTDSVALRFDEDATADNLAAYLKNIERLDLSIEGANAITDGGVAGNGLSLADVVAITGKTNGVLTIDGDDQDQVMLSSSAEWTRGDISGDYQIYTSGNVSLRIDDDIMVSFSA